jgi:molybdenum cofactor cytidylyltransferase
MITKTPQYCGVILAAGPSTRMVSDKALLAWPPRNKEGSTFLSSAVDELRDIARAVVVVVGTNRKELAPILGRCGAKLAVNPAPEHGPLSSMQIGLKEALKLGFETAIITPVDRPPLLAGNLHALCNAYANSSDEIWGMIPAYNGKHGHPLIAGPELIRALLRSSVEGNAQEILGLHQKHLQYLELSDPAVMLNVNTPEDYEQLTRMQK